MRTVAAAILKMKDLQRAKRVLKDKAKNPFDTFDWLLLENGSRLKTLFADSELAGEFGYQLKLEDGQASLFERVD